MTAEPCRDRTGDLAAEALGRLAPEESLRLASHVDGCRGCRMELAELRRAAAALDRADPSRVADRAEPPDALAGRVVARVGIERRRRTRDRWRRTVGAVAAAAVVAVLVVAGALLARPDGDGGERRADVAFTVAPAGAESDAVLIERRWGTEVRMTVTGLTDDEVYWLWLSGEGQERVAAGTFSGLPGRAQLVMASALPLGDVQRVWVTDRDGTVVLDGRVPVGLPPD